jgi:uncharacterized membrane protein YkoI
MKRLTKLTLTAVAATSLLSLGVYAASNDAIPAATPAISLSQAIAVAEQQAAGKATRAEYEQSGPSRVWVYDVEVSVGAKILDVKVDATTGRVVSTKEDSADQDDEHDEKD